MAKSYVELREMDCRIAERLFGHAVIRGDMGHPYSLSEEGRWPVWEYTRRDAYAAAVLNWLVAHEGEVWISYHGMVRNEETGEIVPREPPFPVSVSMPNTFYSTPILPYAEAVCTAALAWIDMDDDLSELASYAGSLA